MSALSGILMTGAVILLTREVERLNSRVDKIEAAASAPRTP